MKTPKKNQKDRPRGVARLREDCVEFVQQVFDFSDKKLRKTWNRGTDIPGFRCPVCDGAAHIECDLCHGRGERKGKWCLACEGLGATGCEECEGGEIPNWPTRKLIYPLPEGFDRGDALATGKFDYIIIVRIGTRYFLAHAIPRLQMRTVKDLPLEMIGAYITLGFLPPAQLVGRLLTERNIGVPPPSLLGHCRRSLATCSRLWEGRLTKFERLFLRK